MVTPGFPSRTLARSWAWLTLLTVVTIAHCVVLGWPAPATAQPAGQQQVVARLDAETATMQQPVQLTIQFSGASRVQVAEPASDDFQVIGQQTFSNTTIINNQVQSNTSWVYVLRPTRTGTLSTGPIRYQTENGAGSLQALTLEVTDGPGTAPTTPTGQGTSQRTSQAPQPLSNNGSATQNAAVARRGAPPYRDPAMYSVPLPGPRHRGPFVTVQSSSDHAYPGQQIVVDYILYEPMSDSGLDVTGLSEPEFTNAWFRTVTEERVGRARAQSSINHNNDFYVPRPIRSLIVVPQESGEFEIPSMELDMARVNFRRREAFSIQSPPTRIEVTDPPVAGRPNTWVSSHVGQYNLRVRADRTNARVGDTVLISVILEGPGNFTGIRPPRLPALDGARVLDPTEDVEINYGRSGWLEGNLVQQFAVVPTEEGDIAIPPLEFAYWDPWQEAYETATSQIVSVHVAGFSSQSAAAQEPETPASENTIEGLPEPRPITGRKPAPTLPPILFLGLSALPLAGLCIMIIAKLVKRVQARIQPQRAIVRQKSEMLQACENALSSGLAADVESAFSRVVADRLGHSGATDMNTLVALARKQQPAEVADELQYVLNEVKTRRYGGDSHIPEELIARIRAMIVSLEGAR